MSAGFRYKWWGRCNISVWGFDQLIMQESRMGALGLRLGVRNDAQ
jgi:hypothetical protein